MSFGDNFFGQFSRYSWFLKGPPSFRPTLESKVRIRHDSISDLTICSVGNWYQTEPHKKFPPFPPARDRIPCVVAAGLERESS